MLTEVRSKATLLVVGIEIQTLGEPHSKKITKYFHLHLHLMVFKLIFRHEYNTIQSRQNIGNLLVFESG